MRALHQTGTVALAALAQRQVGRAASAATAASERAVPAARARGGARLIPAGGLEAREAHLLGQGVKVGTAPTMVVEVPEARVEMAHLPAEPEALAARAAKETAMATVEQAARAGRAEATMVPAPLASEGRVATAATARRAELAVRAVTVLTA